MSGEPDLPFPAAEARRRLVLLALLASFTTVATLVAIAVAATVDDAVRGLTLALLYALAAPTGVAAIALWLKVGTARRMREFGRSDPKGRRTQATSFTSVALRPLPSRYARDPFTPAQVWWLHLPHLVDDRPRFAVEVPRALARPCAGGREVGAWTDGSTVVVDTGDRRWWLRRRALSLPRDAVRGYADMEGVRDSSSGS